MSQQSTDAVVVRRPDRVLLVRDAVLIGLTVLTGATDAFAFLRLGGVFTSVMTGNMVLMGLGAGRGDSSTITHTVIAFGGYVAGAIIGGAAAGKPRKDDPLWPRIMTWCLCFELVLYFAVTISWVSVGSGASSNVRIALLGVLAAALGLQSSAVLRLGLSGFSTTYLTGTLTQVMSSLASTRNIRGVERAVAALVALVAGAAAGSALGTWEPRVAPVLLVGLLAAAVAVAFVVLDGQPSRP